MEIRLPATEAVNTVGGLLGRGRTALGEAEAASLEAEILLGHALGRGREWLHAHSDETPADADIRRYFCLIEERALTGCPIAYLIGEREFHGLRLAQARGVLVPRPETEELVDLAAAHLEKAPAAGVIVDAGCGCGAIGIALAVITGRNVIAIDIACDAVELTRRNAALCAVDDKVRVLRGSWLEPLSFLSPVPNVAAVVSNPPYVRTNLLPGLPRDIFLHEPHMALDGGVDGLDSIRRLMSETKSRLCPSGFFAFEFADDQEAQVLDHLKRGGWSRFETKRDLAGLPRMAVAYL